MCLVKGYKNEKGLILKELALLFPEKDSNLHVQNQNLLSYP